MVWVIIKCICPLGNLRNHKDSDLAKSLVLYYCTQWNKIRKKCNFHCLPQGFLKKKKLEQSDDNVELSCKENPTHLQIFALFFIFGAQFFCGNSNLKH